MRQGSLHPPLPERGHGFLFCAGNVGIPYDSKSFEEIPDGAVYVLAQPKREVLVWRKFGGYWTLIS